MNIEQKLAILKGLGTKDIIEKLPRLEEALEKALREDATNRNLNYGYLASIGNDCAEVKRILAELSFSCSETTSEGKKMTVADRENWLLTQRTINHNLVAAINRQESVSFNTENNRITIEMAKKALESAKVVLALKTAQIKFLTEGEG